MSNQIAIPAPVDKNEISRKKTLGSAMIMCAELGGYDLDKESQIALGVDKAQFSRWKNDSEGIAWPKLCKLMDLCGNHAPVYWMLYQLGYDLDSLKKRETELEKKIREQQELIDRQALEIEILSNVAGAGR